MISFKIFALAVIFVATSGAVFSDYFKSHKVLSFLAAIVALAGSYYLFQDLYSDLKRAGEEKKVEVGVNPSGETPKDISLGASPEASKKDFTKVSKDGIWFVGKIISITEHIIPNDGASGGSRVFYLRIKDESGNEITAEFYPYHITRDGNKIIDIIDMYQNMSKVEWEGFTTRAVYSNLKVGILVEIKIVCGRDHLCYTDTLKIL